MDPTRIHHCSIQWISCIVFVRLSQVLLQKEQRIALTDPILLTVLQDCYDLAILPYEGNKIFVCGIELTEAPQQEFSDTV